MSFKFTLVLKENEDYKIEWKERYAPFKYKEKVIRLNDGKELGSVRSPRVNDVVLIEKGDCLIPIVITDGTYLSNGRVSNFWSWQEINEDLSLSEEKHGYGDFYEQPLNLVTSVSIGFGD